MSDEQRIRKEAARWLATLQSGDVDARTEAEFLRWQAADERHMLTMEHLHRHLESLREAPLRAFGAENLTATLAAPSRRRFIRGALMVASVGAGSWLLGRTGSTGFAMPGDVYTNLGERRQFTLDDGSRLTLNAASRVSPGARSLVLRQGELLLAIAGSTTAGTFTITTDFCRVHGEAKSVLIRQDAASCFTLALDSNLTVEDTGGRRYGLSPQQWVVVAGTGMTQHGRAGGSETAWLDGLLAVENRSLAEVVERLRPYHRGVLRLDARVAHLRISGTFPLDDTGHALAMLAASLPIRIEQRIPFLVSIRPA